MYSCLSSTAVQLPLSACMIMIESSFASSLMAFLSSFEMFDGRTLLLARMWAASDLSASAAGGSRLVQASSIDTIRSISWALPQNLNLFQEYFVGVYSENILKDLPPIS